MCSATNAGGHASDATTGAPTICIRRVPHSTHPSPGLIPLHSDQPQYSHKLYWRLQHTSLGGILAGVISRVILNASHTDELEMAKELHSILTRRRPHGVDVVPSGEGSGG
jgi:hypothetical protein